MYRRPCSKISRLKAHEKSTKERDTLGRVGEKVRFLIYNQTTLGDNSLSSGNLQLFCLMMRGSFA